MIIKCINCNKKFNVDNKLIPEDGRLIQCGSCNHNWHYKIEKLSTKSKEFENTHINEMPEFEDKSIIENSSTLNDEQQNKSIQQGAYKEVKKSIQNNYKTENNGLINFFSYLIVFIISVVALIILIDTLKSPLITLFPGLEIILFNLFETLKDVKLFIIDLT